MDPGSNKGTPEDCAAGRLPVRTHLAGRDEYWKITNAMVVFVVLPLLVILTMIPPRVRSEKLVGAFKGV